jgi:hypothetical protein
METIKPSTEVFAISELREQILTLCTGATLHPLRSTNRGFRDTINELLLAKEMSQEHHRWSRCHYIVAVKRGCVACIKHAVLNSGTHLGRIVCGLCEYGYYSLANMLLPKLQFVTPAESRQYYNELYTLLHTRNENETVIQLKSLLMKRRRKMSLDPEYVWTYTPEQLFDHITTRRLPIDALAKWISRSNYEIIDQIAFSEQIIQQIDNILIADNNVFVSIVCALFERGLNVAALRVMESVAPFYCTEYGVNLINAAISAPGGDVNLYLRVCEYLRDYRLTQERFYLYMSSAIIAEKYDICVELRKIAIVCGFRRYLTYSQSYIITTRGQVRCANVFEGSPTCENILNGVITATEYTAQCTLTTNALLAGLTTYSSQHYRRATFLSVVWSTALDQLSMEQKYKFYHLLNVTPESLINLLNVYNGITMRAISIDLYNIYVEYGPHIHPNFYNSLYSRADCTVSKVLLGMLSRNIPDVSLDDIGVLIISRYELLLNAAVRLRKSWWLEKVYQYDESSWESIRELQLQTCGVVFYKPDTIDDVQPGCKRSAYKSHPREAKNKTRKRRRLS